MEYVSFLKELYSVVIVACSFISYLKGNEVVLTFMKFKISLFLKRFLYKIGCTSAKISSKLGFLHSVCTTFGIEEGV